MEVNNKIYSLIEIGFKTAVGFLPGAISAAFNAVYDNIKTNILSQRAEKWKKEVIDRLGRLETNYDELVSNNTFATTLIRTSELAIKTELDEKRQMLANALVNTYECKIDEDRTIIFLNLIEKYTILHIEIIKYLHDDFMKETFFNNKTPTFLALFKIKFFDVEDAYLRKSLRDLQNDYLVENFKEDSRVEFWGKRFKLLTKLGNDFYDYLRPNNEV